MVHDLVKIKLIDMGYTPNYPYHLLSTKEMCDGFMNCTNHSGYFFDAYPDDINPDLTAAYSQLVLSIQYYMAVLRFTTDSTYRMPDWVYSYMLGATIGVMSDTLDIHDLIYPLGVDNIDDIFDAKCAQACYDTSLAWLHKSQQSKMIAADMELSSKILEYFKTCSIYDTTLYDLYMSNEVAPGIYGAVDRRPPTMFGEPHVVREVRLSQTILKDR